LFCQAVTMAIYNALTSSRVAFAIGTMSIFSTLGGLFSSGLMLSEGSLLNYRETPAG
jgi:hypothetical protein